MTRAGEKLATGGILERLSTRLPIYTTVSALTFLSYEPRSFLNSYKPLFGDLLKSSAVLLNLPFSVGDTVSISSNSGKVSSISLNYVTLDSKECTTYVPTHSIYSSTIKKYK